MPLARIRATPRLASSRALHDLALIFAGANRGDESLAAHRRAIGLLEPMAAESGEARRVLAHSYNDLAGMLGVTEPAEGERLYRRALEIRERIAAENPSESARAVAEMNELLALGLSDDDRYNAACVYSLSSAAARAEGRQGDDEPARLADDYAERALRVLGELSRAGYFSDPQRAANLKADADMEPLRSFAEFQELLAPVQAP
jgi:hypothetical protein